MLEPGAGRRGVAGGIVVFQIVDERVIHLGQRIAVMGIGEDVVLPGPLAADGFGVTAELLIGGVGIDAVLHGDGGDEMSAVAHAVNVVPRRERDGGVIHDDVRGAIKTERIISGAHSVGAGADAKVTADDVVAVGEGDFAAINDDAAGSGLAGDGQIA